MYTIDLSVHEIQVSVSSPKNDISAVNRLEYSHVYWVSSSNSRHSPRLTGAVPHSVPTANTPTRFSSTRFTTLSFLSFLTSNSKTGRAREIRGHPALQTSDFFEQSRPECNALSFHQLQDGLCNTTIREGNRRCKGLAYVRIKLIFLPSGL